MVEELGRRKVNHGVRPLRFPSIFSDLNSNSQNILTVLCHRILSMYWCITYIIWNFYVFTKIKIWFFSDNLVVIL